jgi:NAD(P)-dependent dehydrogenase (short-subunit alcohol dehydrogenase family)
VRFEGYCGPVRGGHFLGKAMRDLAGKTAFVTGAASGIGFGIATALAQAGVKVMLCDIEEAALTKAAADLKLTNADVDGVKADVSLKGELQAAADATVARYGKIHILVNNAGVGGGSSYGRWTDASWNWTLSVNLMSVVWGIEILVRSSNRTAREGRSFPRLPWPG